MKLSIITDEFQREIADVLPVLRTWGLSHCDLRGRIFGKKVHELDTAELSRLKELLARYDMRICALESSLAEQHLPTADIQEVELKKLDGLMRVGEALDCHLVRSYHYWQPQDHTQPLEGEDRQRVLDAFAPIAERARRAGLIFGFENCGVTPEVELQFIRLLGIKEWGLTWDPANHWKERPKDISEPEYIFRQVEHSRIIHVKANGILPELTNNPVPWEKILAACRLQNYQGPVSIETHTPPKEAPFRHEASLATLETLLRMNALEIFDPPRVAPETTPCNPVLHGQKSVGFVVVGMGGMGRNRSKIIQNTPGARLVGVCDRDEARCKVAAAECGVEYATDLQDWLKRDDVDAIFVLTPTGRHAEVAIPALNAAKHVVVTKPMEASLEACSRMLNAARESKRLLAVDFEQRFLPETHALRDAVRKGRFGRLLNGTALLKIRRTPDYFLASGGWRGTLKMDGGGVLSNQAIHLIDKLIFCFGFPRLVRCNIKTQVHEIEGEDFGAAEWQYADGFEMTLAACSTYPVKSTWFQQIEVHGSTGAYFETEGGPLGTQTRWNLGEVWSPLSPEVPRPPWPNSISNVVAAILNGSRLECDAQDGFNTQSVLNGMYRSARAGGNWVELIPADCPHDVSRK